MKRALIIFMGISTILHAQTELYDIQDQIGIISEIIPGTNRIVVFIGEEDIPTYQPFLSKIQMNTGITLIPVRVNIHKVQSQIRELQRYLRQLFDLATKEPVNAMVFIKGKDAFSSHKISLKVLAQLAQKANIPSFASHEDSHDLKMSAKYHFDGEWWNLELYRKNLGDIQLDIPSADQRFRWVN